MGAIGMSPQLKVSDRDLQESDEAERYHTRSSGGVELFYPTRSMPLWNPSCLHGAAQSLLCKHTSWDVNCNNSIQLFSAPNTNIRPVRSDCNRLHLLESVVQTPVFSSIAIIWSLPNSLVPIRINHFLPFVLNPNAWLVRVWGKSISLSHKYLQGKVNASPVCILHKPDYKALLVGHS